MLSSDSSFRGKVIKVKHLLMKSCYKMILSRHRILQNRTSFSKKLCNDIKNARSFHSFIHTTIQSLRVIWVFGTKRDRGSDESVGGVSRDLDHDPTLDELVKTGFCHQK